MDQVFRPFDAKYPSQTSAAAAKAANQLAHVGTSTLPISTGQPNDARANCNTATIAKTTAASLA